MIERDYILRQIHQMVAALLQLFKLTRERAFHEVLEVVDEQTQLLLGLKLDSLIRLHGEAVIDLLEKDLSTAESLAKRKLLLAAMLQHAAGAKAAAGLPDEAAAAARLGLSLALSEPPRTSRDLEHAADPDILLTYIPGGTLAVSECRDLIKWREAHGRFAGAEDMLFNLIETPETREAALQEAEAFFRRLLKLDDGTLAAGNLPRDEVESGLREVRARAPANSSDPDR